jgi:site-specific recombinase
MQTKKDLRTSGKQNLTDHCTNASYAVLSQTPDQCPYNQTATFQQELARWRTAFDSFGQKQSSNGTREWKDLHVRLAYQLIRLKEVTSRLWLFSIVSKSIPGQLFDEALLW